MPGVPGSHRLSARAGSVGSSTLPLLLPCLKFLAHTDCLPELVQLGVPPSHLSYHAWSSWLTQTVCPSWFSWEFHPPTALTMPGVPGSHRLSARGGSVGSSTLSLLLPCLEFLAHTDCLPEVVQLGVPPSHCSYHAWSSWLTQTACPSWFSWEFRPPTALTMPEMLSFYSGGWMRSLSL